MEVVFIKSVIQCTNPTGSSKNSLHISVDANECDKLLILKLGWFAYS